jgi:hypothetical protein
MSERIKDKIARGNLYFVTTSTGYPAIWDAIACVLIIVSESETETRKALARMVKPEKEKLPWKKGLDQIVDEALDAKEKAERDKYRGVSWHSQTKRWRATISINKKQIHLGAFDDKEEATRVVAAKRAELASAEKK